MSKVKEILNEKSTWAVGVPSLVVGAMTILDADHAQEVAKAITGAGERYVEGGGIIESLGWFAAAVLGIFMRGR